MGSIKGCWGADVGPDVCRGAVWGADEVGADGGMQMLGYRCWISDVEVQMLGGQCWGSSVGIWGGRRCGANIGMLRLG